MARAMGSHFNEGAKIIWQKLKLVIYTFWYLYYLYFAPHTTIYCQTASTERTYLVHEIRGVVPAPSSIMTKLWYWGTTRR